MTSPFLPYRVNHGRQLICIECLKPMQEGARYSAAKGTVQHWLECPESTPQNLSRMLETRAYDQHSNVQTRD
jgi:hypothetical protein